MRKVPIYTEKYRKRGLAPFFSFFSIFSEKTDSCSLKILFEESKFFYIMASQIFGHVHRACSKDGLCHVKPIDHHTCKCVSALYQSKQGGKG